MQFVHDKQFHILQEPAKRKYMFSLILRSSRLRIYSEPAPGILIWKDGDMDHILKLCLVVVSTNSSATTYEIRKDYGCRLTNAFGKVRHLYKPVGVFYEPRRRSIGVSPSYVATFRGHLYKIQPRN